MPQRLVSPAQPDGSHNPPVSAPAPPTLIKASPTYSTSSHTHSHQTRLTPPLNNLINVPPSTKASPSPRLTFSYTFITSFISYFASFHLYPSTLITLYTLFSTFVSTQLFIFIFSHV